jgi:voltage-gated potassium channel
VLATVLPSDADNVFICLSARNLNADMTIIARGEQGSTEKKLRQAGANHVIMPAAIGGRRIAELILHPGDNLERKLERVETSGDELMEMGLQVRFLAIPEQSPVLGVPIDQVQVAGRDPFIVVGVHSARGKKTHGPHSDHRIEATDQIVAIGPQDDEPKLMLKASAQ